MPKYIHFRSRRINIFQVDVQINIPVTHLHLTATLTPNAGPLFSTIARHRHIPGGNIGRARKRTLWLTPGSAASAGPLGFDQEPLQVINLVSWVIATFIRWLHYPILDGRTSPLTRRHIYTSKLQDLHLTGRRLNTLRFGAARPQSKLDPQLMLSHQAAAMGLV